MAETKIIDAIIGDAKAEAEEILSSAGEEAKKTVECAKEAAQQRASKIADAAKAEGEEIVRRAMLVAKLEARKNSLASRRELLEKAFEDAFSELSRLEGQQYAELIARLVVNAAETGTETVVTPEDTYERYTKPYIGGKTMLEYLNAALEKAGKKGALKLGKPAKIAGGVTLVGEIADIGCSFGSLIAAFREEHETEVSKLLFGSEE